jgi:hypothetical protein
MGNVPNFKNQLESSAPPSSFQQRFSSLFNKGKNGNDADSDSV